MGSLLRIIDLGNLGMSGRAVAGVRVSDAPLQAAPVGGPSRMSKRTWWAPRASKCVKKHFEIDEAIGQVWESE